MKSYLFVFLLAVALMAARGSMETWNDLTFAGLDDLEDPAEKQQLSNDSVPIQPPGGGEKPECNCDKECRALHSARLPEAVQAENKYLSYENFPILCRDASAILLPPNVKPQKKYVCKQVFDCCRKCNWLFYRCLATRPNTYGFCIRGAYRCMCDCIEKKSNNELPASKPVEKPEEPETQSPPTTKGQPFTGEQTEAPPKP